MPMTNTVMELLEKRALSVEICAMMGFDTRNNVFFPQDPDGPRRDNVLAIPFFREGRLVYSKLVKWEDGGKLVVRDRKGVPSMLWNEDCLREPELVGKELIITEGELDAVAAIESGFVKTCSVPDGAPNPGEHREDIPLEDRPKYKWWAEARELITEESCPTVIVAGDGDGPGAQLLQDLSHLIGRMRVKYLTYPLLPEHKRRPNKQRCKDLNEVKEHYGVKGVQKVIEKAEFIKVGEVYLMSELPPVPEPRVYRMNRRDPEYSKHYGLRFGDFVVVTGVPSYGKSTWANDTYCEFADEHGLRIAWASFEQNPQIDHKRNLRSWFLKKPVYSATPQELDEADAWIDRHHTFVVPEEDTDVTLEWMLEKLAYAIIRHGCKIVVLDPWNEMDHLRFRDETLTEYVGRAIKTMKRFARKHAVHFVVIAHPAKLQRAKDTGMYPKPSLYDISDSANFYNKADLGVVVHRSVEEIDGVETSISSVQFAKSRYHDIIGPIGEVVVTLDVESRRFDYVRHLTDGSQTLSKAA